MQQPAEHRDPELSQLSRFQQASAHSKQLRAVSFSVAGAAIVMLLTAWVLSLSGSDAIWWHILSTASATLLTLLIGLYSALQVTLWRERSLGARQSRPHEPPAVANSPAWEVRLWRLSQQLTTGLLRALRREEIFTIAVAAVAIDLIRHGWDLNIAGAAPHRPGYVAAGLVLAGGYGLLVTERHLNSRPASEWPEAAALAQLLRPAILVLLLVAICLVFDAPTRIWPVRLAVLAGLLPAALAAELLVRALIAAITRAPVTGEPPLSANSLVARCFVWPPQPLALVHAELSEHFGIDLRQNWTFRYLRSISLPVGAVVVLAGWLTTGLHELPMASRGIYERLGRPVSIWNPGLHWGLPWPIATVLPVDYGVVHELVPTVSEEGPVQPDQSTADGPAPASANRLWDVTHTGDSAQVISSQVAGRQNFQVVNLDVRLVYRIGLNPEAAMAATYHCADIEALLRSTANRVMLHYFASRTLDGLLGGQREALAPDIRQAVQAQLDRFGSGVELLSVLIESIHPPAGAAAAYHSVQAAVINAQTIIAQERGAAANTANDAQLVATSQIDSSTAAARENTIDADVAKLAADAELQGYRAAGNAFIRERYLDQLAAGLSTADLIIIDHRIAVGNGAPTIDLRTFDQSLPTP